MELKDRIKGGGAYVWYESLDIDLEYIADCQGVKH